jgi:hypothetical protein
MSSGGGATFRGGARRLAARLFKPRRDIEMTE